MAPPPTAPTVRELRDRAATLGIRGRWRMRRDELLEAIAAAQAAPEAAAPAPEEAPGAGQPADGTGRPSPPLAPAPAPAASELVAFPPALRPSPAASLHGLVPLPEAPAGTDAAGEAAPPPRSDDSEPESVFIDRGPPLPQRYAARRCRVLVQSAACAWVYWELEAPGAGLWRVEGRDVEGRVLDAFEAWDGLRGGFLRLETARLERVHLRHPGLDRELVVQVRPASGRAFATQVARGASELPWVAAGSAWARPSAEDGLREAAPIPAPGHAAAEVAPRALPHSPVRRAQAG